MRSPLLLLATLLGACPPGTLPDGGGAIDQTAPRDLTLAPDLTAPAGDLAFSCRADKISVPQSRGCESDGSLEFCLPASDGELLARAKAIAPTLRCAPGGGRARCNVASELLCFFPTGAAECVAVHGAMTDAAWSTLCQLAALPQVRQIVQTWLE